MNRITPDELAALRRHYPSGCRVKLICMKDPYRDLEAGTLGTVMHVDDIRNDSCCLGLRFHAGRGIWSGFLRGGGLGRRKTE